MKEAHPPRATARLQFHPGFTLADAERVVPYFAKLGISHLYASPLFKARRGSTHGYDVIDYGTINPELGGRAALERLAATLHRHGMGLVLDIVPNHMAADPVENPWWRDVLAKGRKTPYAAFFDIDWFPPEPWLRGKLLLPVLGRPYAETLAKGEIRLEREAGEIAYFEHRFPLADGTATGGNLHTVLEAQHYQLAWWRTAGDAINWRRFFNINGLVALRAERAAVFNATHQLVVDLYAAGLIDGVRVDHVDGLADPAAYCRRLRRTLAKAGKRRPYIVVEKILASGEVLPASWEVDGSTGYDFMAEVGGLLHDPAGEAPLSRFWTRITGKPEDFPKIELGARTELLSCFFAAELGRAVRALTAAGDGRDLPSASLERIVTAVASHFPVYRLYPDGKTEPLEHALAAAEKALPRAEKCWLEQVRATLTVADRQARPGQIRFQLLTAPLAAKAGEDTAFYRYGRLLSRNEVGTSPTRFALAPHEFHRTMIARQQRFPHAMLATATHDHKRGEDVRARLTALSEIPTEWMALIETWMRRNEARRRMFPEGAAPCRGDELMLYQILVGAWPALLDPTDEPGVAAFVGRIADWQEKALREAKERSDWAAPNEDYESACREFLMGMLADPAFRREVAGFAARIGPAGAVNGLVQTMLRLTVPGVPDLYQGAEFWDESLVDPDNRRPVDFAIRKQALKRTASLLELLNDWRTGHIKQALIACMLELRARLPRLFATGTYRPLAVSGPRADHALAFLREDGPNCLMIAVTRLAVPLLGVAQIPWIDPAVWVGTVLHVPVQRTWRNALISSDPLVGGDFLRLEKVFGILPVACWASRGRGGECGAN
ncbi:MAG TPA: malto-oligosyltrehalose synthase [Acetobacteraceae bacterium]|nr:malto-oligosyltrehalose synthase [Acetobacteraceae bacterium]